ncbi:MAG: ATP-dependent ligase [Planctomycetaceae bacterium]|nr:ATP-dependent ligase [Planctomycetaceae bacterium]
MTLEIKPPLLTMEARPVAAPPTGDEWQYEPKWDGFRCLIFKDGVDVYLQSKSGQPLARYFPDIVDRLKQLVAKQFAIDSEIVVPIAGRLSFDDLLMRVHPAASRVQKLANEHPAMLIVFDLLADIRGKSLLEMPLKNRRAKLNKFAETQFATDSMIRLSPATTDITAARKWFATKGVNLDGIVAKRLDLPYCSGNRDGMQKIKHRQTADCVVAGFRYLKGKDVVGSLLLGLYDTDGRLNHVGFTSSFKANERAGVTEIVEPLKGGAGFSGRAPGGPSRWNGGEAKEWEPLKPKLVVEVAYDHFTGDRFRHGTQLIRWRPDKKAKECSVDQVENGTGTVLQLLQS